MKFNKIAVDLINSNVGQSSVAMRLANGMPLQHSRYTSNRIER